MTDCKKKGKKVYISVDGLYRSAREVIDQGCKADYGKKTLEALSLRLSAEYSCGYTLTNFKYMRQFYLAFPIGRALRDELGRTHYRILMREDDPIAREWYMNECVACGWSSRDLDRQVSTDAYRRRLAARGTV